MDHGSGCRWAADVVLLWSCPASKLGQQVASGIRLKLVHKLVHTTMMLDHHAVVRQELHQHGPG